MSLTDRGIGSKEPKLDVTSSAQVDSRDQSEQQCPRISGFGAGVAAPESSLKLMNSDRIDVTRENISEQTK